MTPDELIRLECLKLAASRGHGPHEAVLTAKLFEQYITGADDSDEGQAETPPKRGRGRPRKHPLPEPAAE